MTPEPVRPVRANALRPALAASALALLSLGGLLAGGCGAAPPPTFSADSAMVHVERQVALGPRVPGTSARDAAARYLGHTLERYGAQVRVQAFEIPDPYRAGPLRLVNLIGSFAPERTRRVMLAAHYDSRPWADQESDSTLWERPIPGAVDGAAGTAVLLELARLVGSALPPDIGVDVVLFDGEDYGREGDLQYYLLGSRGFLVRAAGYRPACMILLDMVGGRGTRIRREGFSVERSPALVDFVFGRAQALGLAGFSNDEGTPVFDDHVPFLQAGWDAIDLFGYDYPAWHTLGDDLEQVDAARLQEVGTLLQSIIYDFDYRRP
jgi:hypothetical protein